MLQGTSKWPGKRTTIPHNRLPVHSHGSESNARMLALSHCCRRTTSPHICVLRAANSTTCASNLLHNHRPHHDLYEHRGDGVFFHRSLLNSMPNKDCYVKVYCRTFKCLPVVCFFCVCESGFAACERKYSIKNNLSKKRLRFFFFFSAAAATVLLTAATEDLVLIHSTKKITRQVLRHWDPILLNCCLTQ